jgi:hypothetical protein
MSQNITQLQAKVTKTGAFDGTGVDISAMSAKCGVHIKVDALTAAKGAVLYIQDSADNFSSDVRTLAVWNVMGEVKSIAPREKDWHEFEIPNVRFGVSSAKMRVGVLSIDGSASMDYEAWITTGTI